METTSATNGRVTPRNKGKLLGQKPGLVLVSVKTSTRPLSAAGLLSATLPGPRVAPISDRMGTGTASVVSPVAHIPNDLRMA